MTLITSQISSIAIVRISRFFKNLILAVRWLCKHKKIAAIPNTAFYSEGHKRDFQQYIRFCFAKDDEVLDKFGDMMREGFKA